MRLVIRAGIVVASVALGLVAGVLAVRYVFPSPALLPGGRTEGTPIQILAFFGSFGLVFLLALAVGCRLFESQGRGLPKR